MAAGGAGSGGHPPAPASFAINGDGTVIAVGYPQEVRPDTDPGENPDIGAVYVFRRAAGGWVQEQRLASSNSSTEDAYGRFVSLDASGTTLAVSRRWGEGKTAGQANGQQGPVELFRHTDAGWVPLATVPVLDDRCYSIALSGDGRTLVRHCSMLVEVLRAPNWQRVADFPLPTQGMNEFHSPWPYERGITINFDGRSFAARSIKMDSGGVDFLASVSIYRERDTGWVQEASVRPGDWMPPGVVDESPGNYGAALSLSRDGRFLAVGSSTDQAIGSGVLYPPIESISDNRNGAVYVYERKPTGWRLRQFIKPNFPGYPYPNFGAGVSLARNGKDLAVGAPGDASNALGIDGDQEDVSAPNRGALWLY
jgi:hypothetical protein